MSFPSTPSQSMSNLSERSSLPSKADAAISVTGFQKKSRSSFRVGCRSGPSAWNIEISSTGRTTSTPCPLMFAGTNHRSTDVTGVGSVLTFLDECKAAMECRKKGTTHDGQLARTMKQAYEKTCEEVPGFSKVQVRIHPCWDSRYGQPCSHFPKRYF